MTTECLTLDKLGTNIDGSVWLAITARKLRERIIAATVGKAVLRALNKRLDEVYTPLRSGVLDRLTDDQLIELSSLLKNLNIYLLKLNNDQDISSHRSLQGELEKISDSVENFESIRENIHLALDPRFKKAVSSAIEKLNLGVLNVATMPR
jgi:hypothetical protein